MKNNERFNLITMALIGLSVCFFALAVYVISIDIKQVNFSGETCEEVSVTKCNCKVDGRGADCEYRDWLADGNDPNFIGSTYKGCSTETLGWTCSEIFIHTEK